MPTETIHAAERARLQNDPVYLRFRALPELAGYEESAVVRLYDCFNHAHYPAGTIVYHARDASQQEVHLILSGHAEARAPSGQPYTRLGPGDVFGLFSFLDGSRPHSATIAVLDDMDVLKISRPHFDMILVEEPLLGNALLNLMFRLVSKMALRLENEYISARAYIEGRS